MALSCGSVQVDVFPVVVVVLPAGDGGEDRTGICPITCDDSKPVTGTTRRVANPATSRVACGGRG